MSIAFIDQNTIIKNEEYNPCQYTKTTNHTLIKYAWEICVIILLMCALHLTVYKDPFLSFFSILIIHHIC